MKKLLAIFILSAVFISCKEHKTEENAVVDSDLISVTDTQFQSVGMAIGNPSEQNFDETVKASGKVDVPPQNRSQITSFIGGYVKSTQLLVGDKVVKGQPLLTLENTEFLDIQKEYLEVASQMNYLKSEYLRQKTLFDEKITSQKNYLKAESDFQRAKGMYQSLKEKLKLLNINPVKVEQGKLTSVVTIYAPISCDIVVMNAHLGMHINPSDVILEIIQTNHLHLELAIFEKDILKIKKEQDILFTVPEASKEVFHANVHLVGKSIEGNDRTINIHAHLDDEIKQQLLTGMFVEASIIVNSKKALAIPKEALLTEESKNFVLLVNKHQNGIYTFKKVAVSIGATSQDYVEIIPEKQIDAQSKILTKGVYDVVN